MPLVLYGMVWYGMVWCGVVWYGTQRGQWCFNVTTSSFITAQLTGMPVEGFRTKHSEGSEKELSCDMLLGKQEVVAGVSAVCVHHALLL